ncbi:MAG: hypothetical protein EHM39_09395 [Chloroflexi bacterium]|nr:MAG: hypothetical protein EHM39_09395 [Chloroflexota bacterium]
MSNDARFTEVVTAIQQQWGPQALRRLAQVTTHTDGISTGYAALDRLSGRAGIPRGALTCLSGRLTSGMTTLALDMLAQAQAEGEVTIYIDADRTLDPAYVVKRGIDLNRLLVVWPRPRELGLAITRDIIAGQGAGVVVFDLGHACPGVPPQPGVARALRALLLALPRSPYALVCLSSASGATASESTASDALNAEVVSRAGIHLCVERQQWLQYDGRVEGYAVQVTALKNKFAPPDQTATFIASLAPTVSRQGPAQRQEPAKGRVT